MTYFLFVRRHVVRVSSHSRDKRRARASTLALLIATFVTATAAAQTTTPQPVPRDPLNTNIAVPTVQYESAFAGYRALGERRLAPWRASNDMVETRGGWRSYAREAAAPTRTSAATVKPESESTATTPAASVATPVKTINGGTHVHSTQ